jgi:lipopolysaccharide transport system ATP-binding protein
MNETLIKVENVSKKFCRNLKRSLWYGMKDLGTELLGQSHDHDGHLRKDEFWAVKDISFELRRGECLGLIGRNGAGKTTLLRILNGLIKPDKGRIEMKGRVGALIALGAGFNPILTGRENIYVNASVLGLNKHEIDKKIDEIIAFADINDFIDAPVQSYSSGMVVRLGFAVATALKPDILLLDEVLAVGDAEFRVKCFNKIQEIMNECAVIFVSHNMPQVTRICNSVLLLRDGEAIAMGDQMGEIIALYHQQIGIKKNSVAEGTGKSAINSIVIQDRLGCVTDTLLYGEPFFILVDFTFSKDVEKLNPRLLITISDQEECNVAQISELLTPCHNVKAHLARLEFEKLQLNAGRYWLTGNILLGERGELSSVIRMAATLTVKNTYVGYAPVIMECKNIYLTKH